VLNTTSPSLSPATLVSIANVNRILESTFTMEGNGVVNVNPAGSDRLDRCSAVEPWFSMTKSCVGAAAPRSGEPKSIGLKRLLSSSGLSTGSGPNSRRISGSMGEETISKAPTARTELFTTNPTSHWPT